MSLIIAIAFAAFIIVPSVIAYRLSHHRGTEEVTPENAPKE
jgi:hypothetical protein